MEIKVIKCRFRNADYPPKLLNSVIIQFLTPKNNDPFIIALDLFEESKPFYFGWNTVFWRKQNAFKHFIKTFEGLQLND